jgi:hypothetical protein
MEKFLSGGQPFSASEFSRQFYERKNFVFVAYARH